MKPTVVLALLLCAAASARAQETRDTFQLHQLVVSVARIPLERAAASAAVSVLNGAELRLRGTRTVADALRMLPGIAISQGGSYGAFGSLFMRGGESDYVQVLIDGIRVNSPGEHFDFGNFTLEDVDGIEVVRGPASVLYGSDAVSGVVQIFTRRGAGRPQIQASILGGRGQRVGDLASGSFGSADMNAQLSGSTSHLNYSTGVSHFSSQGAFAFNNQNDNTGWTGRIAYMLRPTTEISATGRYSRNLFHYPTDGSGVVVDANQADLAQTVAAGLEIVQHVNSKLETRVLASYDRNQDEYNDPADNAGDTLGFYAFTSNERFQRADIDARVNYALALHSILTVGAEYETQHERGSSLSQSEFGPFSGASREARDNRAAYGQLLGLLGTLNYQLGARVDDNQRFGTFGTYRAGISAPLGEHLRVRASAGTAFKQPRFYEQFATGFVIGNPDLKPEKSASVEGGMEYQRGSWRVSGSYFAQRFRDLIQYVAGSGTPDEPNYTNLGAARANGLELEAERAWQQLSLRASYTHLDTKVTDAGTGQDPLFTAGSKLVRRPSNAGALAAGYNARAWSVTSTLNYAGTREDLDFSNYPYRRVRLPAYTRVDVSAEHELLRPGLRASAKVENAFNTSYQEAFNFPALRRVIYVGLKYGR